MEKLYKCSVDTEYFIAATTEKLQKLTQVNRKQGFRLHCRISIHFCLFQPWHLSPTPMSQGNSPQPPEELQPSTTCVYENKYFCSA